MQGPSNPETIERAAPLFGRTAAELAPRVRDGVLDLLGDAFAPTVTQRMLDTAFTAWLYDATRDRLAPRFGIPAFAREADDTAARLAIAPGDVVLDVACGHGNFTVELARRAGPRGLVVGLDISAAMLARAANRVRRARLENVLLVRGDALALPFRDAVFPKLNCSGGLHQMPDLGRALAEMARVSQPGARFSGTGFAATGARERGVTGWLWRRFQLHFVPTELLAKEVERAGFGDVRIAMMGPWMAIAEGRRSLA